MSGSSPGRVWKIVTLIAVVLAAAAAGVATRAHLDRAEQPTGTRELLVRPPALPDVTGSAEASAWDVRDPGQRSYQALFTDRRPDEIRPPVMSSCEELMGWAQQQGGIVLGKPVVRVSIDAPRGFRVETLRPSVISHDQPAGTLLACHFIRYPDDGYRWKDFGLTTTDIPPAFDHRDSYDDEETHGAGYGNEFRLDTGDCENCAYEIVARLRMRDDGSERELAFGGPDGETLRIGAYRPERIPDLTWCEDTTAEDVDGDGFPEGQLREADFHTVTRTDRCGGTSLRG